MTHAGLWAARLYTSQEAMAGLSDDLSPHLFATRAWFETLVAHGFDQDQAVLAASSIHPDHGKICLPLHLRTGSNSAVYGVVVEGLSNFYSSLLAPVGQEGQGGAEALAAMLAALVRRGGYSDVVDLRPLDPDAPFFKDMQTALRASGFITDRYFCFGNWYLSVDRRDYAAYLQSVPSRLRNTIRRARRRLDSHGDWAFELHTHDGPTLRAAVADFRSIYAQSWKQPEPFPDFIEALCRRSASEGWLRLGVLRVKGRPAAAQIWLVRQGRALIFKLAHDEQLKSLSAGTILTAELMRHVIDVDRAVEVDFLTGDDPYKADWMSHRRERVGLLGFRRRSVRGLLSALRHFAGKYWRAHVLRPQTAAPTPLVDLDDAR